MTEAPRRAAVIVSREHLARLHHRLRERLPIWTVYRPVTREYPGVWVARMHVALPQPRHTRFVMTHDTLEGLRANLPPGTFRLPRDLDDPPEIEEVWV
jgi:hypothetical protein